MRDTVGAVAATRGIVLVVVARGGVVAGGFADSAVCLTSAASSESGATGVCWSCSHSATSIASSSTTDASSSGGRLAVIRHLADQCVDTGLASFSIVKTFSAVFGSAVACTSNSETVTLSCLRFGPGAICANSRRSAERE